MVETDALYIKGMLTNPSAGPNATINRWIEEILMYHFTLRHVPGIRFGPDGLSRRDFYPGDEVWPESKIVDDDPTGLVGIEYPHPVGPMPLDFEEFKRDIDTRGGYLVTTD